VAVPESPVLTCSACGVRIDTRVCQYLWVGHGWRGRAAPRPRNIEGIVLCGCCGSLYIRGVTEFLNAMGTRAMPLPDPLERGVVFD